MSTISAFGKKAFTTAVVTTTIAWSVGFSALVPLAAHGAAAGDLIRGSLPAVYYYGADGKRYVFPNEKTYKSWYPDFSGVKVISDTELGAIPMASTNVTYRASVGTLRAVKVTSAPTTYWVTNGGELRAIPDQATAVVLLGADWNKKIDDLLDVAFSNYKVGAALATTAKVADFTAAAATIGADKSLVAGTTPAPVAGAVTLSLAADSPASATAPINAGDVIVTKILFSGTGKVKTVKVTRSGLSLDTDLSSVKLFDGTTQLGTNQTFDANHQATFNLTTLWDVGGSKTLTIAGDIAAAAGANSVVLGINAATDVTLEAGTVGGTFPLKGNAVSISTVAILGAITATVSQTIPATGTVDAGNASPVTLLNVALLESTGREDIEITSFTAQKSGNHIASDITGLELYNVTTATVLATTAGWNADSLAVFSLSATPLKLLKGGTVTLEVRVPAGKIIAGASRTLSAQLPSGNPISARGMSYNLGVVTTVAGGTRTTAFVTTINAGSITIMKSASTPSAGNISPGQNDVKLATWDVTVKGEDLRSTSAQFSFTDTAGVEIATAQVTSCVLKDKTGAAVTGLVNPTAAGVALVAGDTVTFTSTITFPIGTNQYSFHCNIGSGAVLAETIQATILPSNTTLTLTGVSTGTAVANTGINSGTAGIAGTAVPGNTMTVRTGGLTVTNLGTPPLSNVVQGAQNVHVATMNLSASAANSGEDVRVTQITVTQTTSATADADDILNLRLTANDGTTLLSDIKQPAGTDTVGDATSTFTYPFTLTTPLVVTRSADQVLKLYVDVKASATAAAVGVTHTFAIAAAANVTVTGVTTGTGATVGAPSGAGQALTVLATGTLTPSIDPAAPVSGVIAAGKTGVTVGMFRFVGASENTQIRTVRIGLTNAAGNAVAGSLDPNVAKVYLYEGDTKLGEAIFSSSVATFDLSSLNFVVDRLGNPRKLTVKADLNTTTAGATSDSELRFNLNVNTAGAGTAAPLGLSSGSEVTLAATAATATFYVRKNVPKFTKTADNTTVLSSGSQDILRFAISADPGADIVFHCGAAAAPTTCNQVGGTFAAGQGLLRFATSVSGTSTLTSASLVKLGTTETILSTTAVTGGASLPTTLVFNFDLVPLTVSGGETVNLAVRASTAGLGTAGNSFGVTLSADTTEAVAGGNNIRWNDDSTAAADYNGFGLGTLPLTNTVKS